MSEQPGVVEFQPKKVKGEFPLTEFGLAERFASQHGADVRFCHPLQKWLSQDGKRWAEDESGILQALGKQTVRTIHREAARIEDDNLRRATAEFARKCERAAAISAMLRLAQSEPGIPVLPADLDKDPWLFNCLSGTVELKTGELREHKREDLITKLAPVAFNPKAECPRWKRFLEEVFAPHPDIIPFLQRAAGYSLTGSTREECLFLFYGPGRNGKGTLLKTLQAAMGDYAGTADFSAFISARDDRGPRDDIANMRGKRLIVAQEGREGAALAESIVKWLTGGDRVRARRLHENSYEFDPTFKLWLATNHKPTIRGTDPAIWSRIKLIPFDVSFEGREDRTLKDDLLKELPGILTWAVQGCIHWQAAGLAFPESVRQATAEYRTESDQVGRFIEECCILGLFATAKGRKLYTEYQEWAKVTGEHVLTETAFGRRLTERGLEKVREKDGQTYKGIGLKERV